VKHGVEKRDPQQWGWGEKQGFEKKRKTKLNHKEKLRVGSLRIQNQSWVREGKEERKKVRNL